MLFDPESFGAAMGDLVREAVEPLHARIAELERQLAAQPDISAAVSEQVSAAVTALPPARDGKDCDMGAVKAMVEEAVKAMPTPANGKDGQPGKDGVSITVDDVRPMLDDAIKAVREEAQQAVDIAIKAMPAPKDGRDGKDGEKGEAGKDAVVDVDAIVKRAVEALPPVVEGAVVAHLTKHPPAAGKDGERGPQGEKGAGGADGIGVAGAMIDRDGVLLITTSSGDVKTLGVVVGKDGRDGQDGKDGLSLDSFEMEYLPETHEMAVRASAAGRVKEVRYPAGGVRPGGYWRDGTKAKAGEAWVHDGSLWIAIKDTSGKPETKSADWIIAARKGRDGERGAAGKDGAPPAPIKLGDKS